tara:strand:- start:30803 stop:31036 length:234 start_codon:yes stop_codon:yes gene_type:complete
MGKSQVQSIETFEGTLTFEVFQEESGGFAAACYQENIYADGDSLENLYTCINREIDKRFQDRPKPEAHQVQLIVYKA